MSVRGRPRVRRRRRGEGSIYKHGRGFCGRLWFTNAAGEKKRLTAFGKTEEDVRGELLRLRVEASAGALRVSSRESVADFLQSWLNAVRPPVLRLATHRLYECLVRIHIVPRVGQVRLADLTERHIENLLGEMKRDGASPRRQQQARGVLHKALRYAVRHKLLSSNPCTSVEKPRANSVEHKVLDEEQAARFLSFADRERLANLYKLAILTGMRQGELLALRWDDVDLRNRSLSVRHTLTLDENGKPGLTEPKTKSSVRRIELSDDTVAILCQQKEKTLSEGLRAEPWVFPHIAGGPCRKEHVERGPLRRILKAAKLPRIRFHDLRHTAATLMLAQGEHPKIVQELLGHSSIKVTLDLYSHVTPTMQRQAADRLSATLRRAGARMGA